MIDWKEKYMRDVEGLNNEGDPIGGDSPSGLRAALEAQTKRANALALVIRDLASMVSFAKRTERIVQRQAPDYLRSQTHIIDWLKRNWDFFQHI